MCKKTWISLCLALILALGCLSSALVLADEANPDEMILVRVNGEAISYGDLLPLYQSYYQQYQSYGMDLSDAAAQQSLLNMVVNSMIQDRILRQKASELGLDVLTPEEDEFLRAQAQGTYDDMVSTYMAYAANEEQTEEENRQATIEMLATAGYTVDALYANQKDAEVFDRLYDYATQGVEIPDAAVQSTYDQGLADAQALYAQDLDAYGRSVTNDEIVYCVPAGYRTVKHILVKYDGAAELKELNDKLAGLTEGDEEYAATQAQIDEKMAEIQPKLDEIYAKIEAGEDFQALIDTYGEDSGMKNGSTAQTGYYMCEGCTVYVPEFTQAGMALEKVGDVSQPVLSNYGFHIIRYNSDVEEKVIPFEEVKEAIYNELLSEALSAAYTSKADEWANAATIEFINPETGEAIQAEE